MLDCCFRRFGGGYNRELKTQYHAWPVRSMRIKLTSIASLLLVAIILTWSGIGLCRKINRSKIYCVEREFDSLPASDHSLTEWLKMQPGIVARTVRVERFESKQILLRLTFLQSQNIFGEPLFPNIEQECEMIGYKGASTPFRDYKN